MKMSIEMAWLYFTVNTSQRVKHANLIGKGYLHPSTRTPHFPHPSDKKVNKYNVIQFIKLEGAWPLLFIIMQ
jgi:hypothetical protein